jgi:hypothetical protein
MENRAYTYYLLFAAMVMLSIPAKIKSMEDLKEFVRETTKGRIFPERDLQTYKDQAKKLFLAKEEAEKMELDKIGATLIAFRRKGPFVKGVQEVDEKIVEFICHSARLHVLQRDTSNYIEDVDVACTKKQVTKVKNKFYYNLGAWTVTLLEDQAFTDSVTVKFDKAVTNNGPLYSMPEQTIWQKWFQPKSKSATFQTSMMPGYKGFWLRAMVVQKAQRAAIKGKEAFERSTLTPEQRALGGLHEYPTIPTPDNAIITAH